MRFKSNQIQSNRIDASRDDPARASSSASTRTTRDRSDRPRVRAIRRVVVSQSRGRRDVEAGGWVVGEGHIDESRPTDISSHESRPTNESLPRGTRSVGRSVDRSIARGGGRTVSRIVTRHRTPAVDRCPDSMAMRSRFDVRSSARVRDARRRGKVGRRASSRVPRRARRAVTRRDDGSNRCARDRAIGPRARCGALPCILDDGDDARGAVSSRSTREWKRAR